MSLSERSAVGFADEQSYQARGRDQLLGATVRWSPESLPVAAHIRVDNALDVNYVDIGNVDQPGRWIRAGLTWTSGQK